MNDITALAQREKFEAWAEEAGALPWGRLKKQRNTSGGYSLQVYTYMWTAWQAASAEMVEALETSDKQIAELEREKVALESVAQAMRDDMRESRTVTAPQSDYFASLVAMARVSADKAMRKFPQPNYVLLKVAEEAGEVVQAGVHYAEKRMEWDQVEGEIVQLLAMLIRLVTEGDQINGITPPAAGIQVIEGEGHEPSN